MRLWTAMLGAWLAAGAGAVAAVGAGPGERLRQDGGEPPRPGAERVVERLPAAEAEWGEAEWGEAEWSEAGRSGAGQGEDQRREG